MLAQLASRIDNLFMFALTSLLALRIFSGDPNPASKTDGVDHRITGRKASSHKLNRSLSMSGQLKYRLWCRPGALNRSQGTGIESSIYRFLGVREWNGTVQMTLSNAAASPGRDLIARPASRWRPPAADLADT